MTMVAMILAAGYATRLYPYTQNTAKPLLTVAGRPIIDYIVDGIRTLPGIEKIIVISNDRFYGHFKDWLAGKNDPMIRLLNDGTTSVENRLGAIGDICFAINKEEIDSDLLIVAGDNLFTFEMAELLEMFNSLKRDCVCVKEVNDVEALRNLGVCELDNNNKVTAFVEKPTEPKSNKAVYACYMIRRKTIPLIFEYVNEGIKRDAPGYFIEWLCDQTDVYAYIINGECYDIGTVEAYEDIQRSFKNM